MSLNISKDRLYKAELGLEFGAQSTLRSVLYFKDELKSKLTFSSI